MGLCSSVQRSQETNNMKLRLSFGSKTDNKLNGIPPSPVKDNNPKNGNFLVDHLALKSQWSPSISTTTFTNYGSKEEAFYDSKAWLDSDCEDDFYSVNGEFTPSRGTTPVHSAINRTPSENPSPTTQKKKNLLELFRESVREDKKVDKVEDTVNNEKKQEDTPAMIHNLVVPKSARSTPYRSGVNSTCSSERTMNEDHELTKEKPIKSVQCCLPSLASCRSFSERRRKASPAIEEANGNA